MKGCSVSVICICLTVLALAMLIDSRVGFDAIIEVLAGRRIEAGHEAQPIEPEAPAAPEVPPFEELPQEDCLQIGSRWSEPEDFDATIPISIEDSTEWLVPEIPKESTEWNRTLASYQVLYENVLEILHYRAEILPQIELVDYTDILTVERRLVDEPLMSLLNSIESSGSMTAEARAAAGFEIAGIQSARERRGAQITVYLVEPSIRQVYIESICSFSYSGHWMLTAQRRLDNANTIYGACLEGVYDEIRNRAIRDGILERCRSSAEELVLELEDLSPDGFSTTIDVIWVEPGFRMPASGNEVIPPRFNMCQETGRKMVYMQRRETTERIKHE